MTTWTEDWMDQCLSRPRPVARSFTEVGVADHTSGFLRCRYTVRGGHVLCKMFGPFSGKAGDLVFRVEDWEHVKKTHPQWQFVDEMQI